MSETFNHYCQFNNEEKKSHRLAKKKIFKRQDPTLSEIERIQVDPIEPEILRKPEDDQFKRQPILSIETTDYEKTEIQRSYLVKSENISRRLVRKEPSFEASDPVDDVGDSL